MTDESYEELGRQIVKLSEKGFSQYSGILQNEVLELKNRKFKEYLLDTLENEESEDRYLLLNELCKQKKMYRLLKADGLMLILGDEHGNKKHFRKYLYCETDLGILEISVIINEAVKEIDKEIRAEGWAKKSEPMRVDYALLRGILMNGGKRKNREVMKLDDPDEIRKPFRELIDRIMEEIKLRIGHNSLQDSKEIENLYTLTRTVEKAMLISLEAHGDMPVAIREKLLIERERNDLKREEIRLNQLGGTILAVKSFSDTNKITAEETVLLMKNLLLPMIVEEKLPMAEIEVNKLVTKLGRNEEMRE